MVGTLYCLEERDGVTTENLINSVSAFSNHFVDLSHFTTSNLSTAAHLLLSLIEYSAHAQHQHRTTASPFQPK
jgi:hypothetical protein